VPEAPSAGASQNEVLAESSARASHDEAPAAATRSSQRGSAVEHRVDKVERPSRYVPREVVRAVFARDGAQCTFVSADGKRCAERGMLELHHVKAFAHGGATTPDNLKVVCRSHNSYFAVQDSERRICGWCAYGRDDICRNAGYRSSAHADDARACEVTTPFGSGVVWTVETLFIRSRRNSSQCRTWVWRTCG
jgi:5-methylcytosine-specific restriction endonuclease McrA